MLCAEPPREENKKKKRAARMEPLPAEKTTKLCWGEKKRE